MTNTAKKNEVPDPNAFEFGFHGGYTISHLAGQYASVMMVIIEMIQNALDKYGKNIFVTLRLSNNRTKNFLKVADDGEGATKDELRKRFGKISSKQKGSDKIGHKGIGNLAPLSIANRYSMITRTKDIPYFRFSIDKEQIIQMEKIGSRFEDVEQKQIFENNLPMTTLITVRSIEPSALKAISKSDEPAVLIAEEISDRFSDRIKQLNVKVVINVENENCAPIERAVVKPQEFPGRKEEITIETKRGPVVFEMYVSNKKHRKPKILVNHQSKFSFSFSNLSDIWQPYQEIFDCGYLQGIIRLDFCELNASRTGFEWNDDLMVFSEAVDEFVKNHAKGFMADLEDESKNERRRQVALEVLDSVYDMFGSNPNLELSALVGLVSAGHKSTGQKGSLTDEGYRTRQYTPKPGEDEDDDEQDDAPKKKPSLLPKKGKEKNMTHQSVSDPTGNRRRRVKGQKGLTIEFAEGSPEKGYRWRVRLEKGIIQVNVSHKDWQEAEDAGKISLRTYIVVLVVGILTLCHVPEEYKIIFGECYDSEFFKFWKLLIPKIGRPAAKK